MSDFDRGVYKFHSRHEGCQFGGRIMSVRSPGSDLERLWCNGRAWEIQKVGGEDRGKSKWIRKVCNTLLPQKQGK